MTVLRSVLTALLVVFFVPAPPAAAVDFFNIMPLGDSITRGYGDPHWNGYRYDLQQRLAGLQGLNPNLVGPYRDGTMGDNNHAGSSGWRIDQISAALDGWLAMHEPKVVLLMAGANDIGQRYQLDTAPDRLMALVERIRVARPSVRIFVASVTQFRDAENDVFVDAFNNSVSRKVMDLGSDLVHFVPQHIIGDTPGDLTDNVHPTPCGYAKIAFVWWYYLGRSPFNTTGKTFPTGYYPFGPGPGPCQAQYV